MPQHKSAIKRVRQNKVRNLRNREQRSQMRTLIKKAFASTEKESATVAYREAVSYLDKMATKGILHKNNAANKKAQLTKHLNSLS